MSVSRKQSTSNFPNDHFLPPGTHTYGVSVFIPNKSKYGP